MPRALLAATLLLLVRPAAAQTQADLTADACARYAAADRDLTATYGKALGAADDALARRRLRAAQRAWSTFRDAHLAALFPLAPGQSPQSVYGSLYGMRRCSALDALTRARTEQLAARLTCEEGDFCDR